jgi:hypothetical protein
MDPRGLLERATDGLLELLRSDWLRMNDRAARNVAVALLDDRQRAADRAEAARALARGRLPGLRRAQ